MRPALLLLLACVLFHVAAQDSIPFQPLAPPDTLRSLDVLQAEDRPCDIVRVHERTITIAPDASDARRAVLVKPWGDRWLAYPLSEGAARWGYSLDGFTADGRYLLMGTWSTNVVTGYQYLARGLQLVDLQEISYAAIETYRDELTWEAYEGTDSMTEHSALDTAIVTVTPPYVHIQNGCMRDGRSVPCADAGGTYVITAGAIAKDASLSVAAAPRSTAPLLEGDHFPFTARDTLRPRAFGPDAGLRPLDTADRLRLLQDEALRYAQSDLFLFARLPDGAGPCITILCHNNDDYDLLWIMYDGTGRLNGLDTLASLYGDGQESRAECAYYDVNGVLSVQVVDEITLRDDVDTMAYLSDTLLYEAWREAEAYIGEENGEARYRLGLKRRPLDLTARWVECHGVNDGPPYPWRPVRALIPEDRRVLQAASGDLDHDGRPDHVFVLTNASDDGDRDLLIVFTARNACGFVQKAWLPGFLPSRDSGGFHDPIGEEGISGISIHGDSLVVHIFGGSAWKWEERSIYRFSAAHKGFFLVRTEGRSYHAPSLSVLEEDLRYFEEARQQGRKLTTEEEERLAEVRRTEEAVRWKGTSYALGEKAMGK